MHVDSNHTESNKPITEYSIKIVSIYDSIDICAIENMLSSPVLLVHTTSPVHAPQIFTYGTESDPTPRNNPPNTVPNVPANPERSGFFRLIFVRFTQLTRRQIL